MKPAPFQYFAPESLDRALALLQEHGDDAKLLSGGQSLIPAMNLRLARPAVLIDLKRIPGLANITEMDGQLRIGGLSTHADLEFSELVRTRCPLLQEAASHIGYPGIRNRGTIGGSIAHADPAATLPAVMATLGGTIVVTGPGGARELTADEFFLGLFMTALAPGEIVTEIRVPVTDGPGQGHSWMELSRRAGDFALVGVAVQAAVSGGIIRQAAMALVGVGLAPVVPRNAIDMLIGRPPAAELFIAAGAAAQADVDPESDIHATAEYRRAMTGVLVARALAQACERAQGGMAHAGD